MNTLNNNLIYHPPGRERHIAFAITALILSTLLHVGIVYWTRDMRLDASQLADKARSEQQQRNRLLKPLQIERNLADPQRPSFTQTPTPTPPSQVTAHELAQILGPQPELVSPLPPATDHTPADTTPKADAHSTVTHTAPLLPRQEVATIVERQIDDSLAALPRREVAAIERISHAPDFTPAADLTANRFATSAGFRPADLPFGFADFESATMLPPSSKPPPYRHQDDLAAEEGTVAIEVLSERFADTPEKTNASTAIDDRLDMALEVFRDPAAARDYFRLSIRPHPAKPLPVLPKDILLVQDCSASMSEARLHFCRKALADIIEQLSPHDRFNIMAFSDNVALCFEQWGAADTPHKETALNFVNNLRSRGETDLYASLQRALELPRDKERPLLALIITDGKPTVGLTTSTTIIGNFTRLNDGNISVLGFGTHPRANTYLLDILTYCNRGETRLNRSARWNIPDEITEFTLGAAKPVMHDIRFVFDSASGSEVYPKLTMNLFAGRSLDLYGSCGNNIKELLVQLRGRASGHDYDAIIQLDLENATHPGTEELRTRWAWQRMYHLIGLYARDPKPLYREVMQGINETYGIPIPYLSDLDR